MRHEAGVPCGTEVFGETTRAAARPIPHVLVSLETGLPPRHLNQIEARIAGCPSSGKGWSVPYETKRAPTEVGAL